MTSFELESATIAHYQLEHMLARGGMSLVYLAHDIETGQKVALKLVHAIEHDYYERFRREASTLAELNNEHILPVIDYGEYQSWFYMTMPYIEYGSLRDRLAKGTLSIQESKEILAQLVDAVQYAHDRGIVHRDVKPSNILLHNGQHVYLADFGLVKHVEEMSDLTQTGCLLGTPEYMAPELTEWAATPSSDIYAIGVVLYYMLTGRVPFSSSTPLGVYWKHLHEQPVAPSTYNSAISPATDAVILHALAKEPEERFHSAKALLEAFEVAIGDERKTIVTIVKVDATLSLLPTPTPFAVARKDKIPQLYRSLPIRVGALLLVAASLLFVIPTLLHVALFAGYDTAQVSLIHASGPIFRSRIETTPSARSTPTIGSTPMGSQTPAIGVAPLVNKTGVQNSSHASDTPSTSNTSDQGNSVKHHGKGNGKPPKDKPKHGHGGRGK